MEAQISSRPYTIGLDLGGTNAVFGIVDAQGNILERKLLLMLVWKP